MNEKYNDNNKIKEKHSTIHLSRSLFLSFKTHFQFNNNGNEIKKK